MKPCRSVIAQGGRVECAITEAEHVEALVEALVETLLDALDEALQEEEEEGEGEAEADDDGYYESAEWKAKVAAALQKKLDKVDISSTGDGKGE